MAISNTALARRRVCLRCAQCRLRPGQWKWAHCEQAGGLVELTPEYCNGPLGNCPLDAWAGLEPADPDQEAYEVRRAIRLRHCAEGRRRMARLVIELLAITTPANALHIIANTLPAFGHGLWKAARGCKRVVDSGETSLPADAPKRLMQAALIEYKTLANPPSKDTLKGMIQMAYEDGAITALEAQDLAEELVE